MVKLTVDYYKQSEIIGGVQSFLDDFRHIYPDFRSISYANAYKAITGRLLQPSQFAYFEVEMSSIISQYLEKYERIFKPDVIVKNSIVGTWKKHRTPMISTIQDNNIMGPEIIYKNGYYSFDLLNRYRHVFTKLQEMTMEKSDAIVASSQHLKEAYEKEFGFDIELIKNGVDTDLFKPMQNREELKRKYGIPEGKKVGVSVTGFLPIKGWHIQARLCHDFPDVYWVIVFKHKAKEPILKNVKMLSKIPREQMPEIYNLGDFFVLPSAMEGCNVACCPPETKIITKEETKAIMDVKVGDKVLTHTGNFNKVTKTMKRQYRGKLIELGVYGRPSNIRLTPEHEVLAIERPRRKYKVDRLWHKEELKWMPASEIYKGDCVVVPIMKEKPIDEIDLVREDETLLHDDNQVWYKMGYSGKNGEIIKYNRFIKVDEELAELLGWYVAEGCVNKNEKTRIIFSLSGKEAEEAKRIQYLIKKIFGVDSNIKATKNSIYLSTCGNLLAKTFSKYCGMGARNKKIPEFIFFGRKNNLEAFLKSYIKGDGSEYKGSVRTTTVSKTLHDQLGLALICVGFKPRLSRERIRIGSFGKHAFYETAFSKNNTKNYLHSNKSWWNGDYLIYLVKSEKEVDYDGYVYNMEVENDNSYCTDSFIVHNCIEAMSCGLPSIMSNTGYFWSPEAEADDTNRYEAVDFGIRVNRWKYDYYKDALNSLLLMISNENNSFAPRKHVESNGLDFKFWLGAWQKLIEKVINRG